MNKVFVYGTLKAGNSMRGIDKISPNSVIVGKAVTTYPDYDMIDLGAFPGAITGNMHIEGEVWDIDEETFHILDQIEGYPNFYNRKIVDTTQGKAWMYYLEDADKYVSSKPRELSTRIDAIEETLIWKSN